METKPCWLDLPRAAYADAATDKGWLHGVTAAAAGLFGAGHGALGCLFEPTAEGVRLTVLALHGCELSGLATPMSIAVSPGLLDRFTYSGSLSTVQQMLGSAYADDTTVMPWLRRMGYADALYIAAGGHAPRQCLILTPRRGKATVPNAALGNLRRASSILALALALRASGRSDLLRTHRESLAARTATSGSRDLAGMSGDGCNLLSPREYQVAALAARGLLNKEIAFELSLATPTVAVLLARASRKLGLRDRIGLRAVSGERLTDPGAMSATERAIVHAVRQGWSNQRIAESRGTSARTVANQLAILYRRIGVRSRSALATVDSDR